MTARTGEFTIDADPSRDLLRVTMRGFYAAADVERYHRAIAAASDALGTDPARQVMVNDITAMQIQSQETVAAFRAVMEDARYRDRRVAFVVASTLARVQLLRIIAGRTVQVFTSHAEAEAWLFAASTRAVA